MPASTTSPTEVLTLSEAAQRLKVSLSTLRRLIRDHELTTIKIRGSRRVTSSAIERYLHHSTAKHAAHSQTPAAQQRPGRRSPAQRRTMGRSA